MKRQKNTIKINKHGKNMFNVHVLIPTTRGFIQNETSKNHNKNQQTYSYQLLSTTRGLSRINHQQITMKNDKHTPTLINNKGFIKNQSSKNQQT